MRRKGHQSVFKKSRVSDCQMQNCYQYRKRNKEGKRLRHGVRLREGLWNTALAKGTTAAFHSHLGEIEVTRWRQVSGCSIIFMQRKRCRDCYLIRYLFGWTKV